MVSLASRAASRRFLITLLCAGCWVPVARAANAPEGGAGPRLLQAGLPTGVSIPAADCDQLVRAIRKATLAHHQEAAAILSAALADGKEDGGRRHNARRDCACVARLFRASVNAAPDHANALLEAAEALCPECADELSATLQRLGDKNVVPGASDPATDPAVNDPRQAAANGSSDLSARDYSGLGFGGPGDPGDPGTGNQAGNAYPGGFGLGPGVGFPGAPGFGGSVPGGGFALPAPVTQPVTSAVNS